MATANLDRCWSYRGEAYGPGEADVPDELHDILSEKGYLSGSTQESESLNDLNVAALKEIAKDEGVEGYSTLNKPDLVAAIEDNRNG